MEKERIGMGGWGVREPHIPRLSWGGGGDKNIEDEEKHYDGKIKAAVDARGLTSHRNKCIMYTKQLYN